MANLTVRSIHHFEVNSQDPACNALWPELIANDKPLDMAFAMDFIAQFQATQMKKHPTIQFNDANGRNWHVQAFSTPSAPEDLTRAMAVYSTPDESGDYRPQAMTIGNQLNFVMFYAMSCCSSVTASSVIGFEFERNFEMVCSDAANGIKGHMHGLFMPGKIKVTRASAAQFDEPARFALKG